MKIRRISLLVITAMVLSITPAFADSVSDRAATVTLAQAKYIPTLDDQHKTLLAIRSTMKVDGNLFKSVNSVISDFESNYKAIVDGLNNPDQAIQPILDLAQEETEEFANSIYQLQILAKTIKTITCVKGKIIMKVVAVAPKCSAGYKKR
jgi:translation initiation factor 2B subunit (eIF-2B alpha/beta/delta family)